MKLRNKTTGEETVAIYATTPQGKKLYHINGSPISDKKLDKEWEKIGDDQPKHTTGKLHAQLFVQDDGAYIYSENFPDAAIVRCYVNDTVRTKEEAEANAKRIVKAVNMHDEFVERIKKAVKDLNRPHSDGSIALHELQQLLKQAEQK